MARARRDVGAKGLICYISAMAKARKARQGILVPIVEEVPRISETERAELRTSLKKARADIAAGNYDVLTPAALRAEFESVFRNDKAGEGAAAPRRRMTAKRKRR